MSILVVYSGRPMHARYPITHDDFRVGRGADADLLINDPALARHQLAVSRTHVVRDLAGGAFGDGTPLNAPRIARVVRAGDTILLLDDDSDLAQHTHDAAARAGLPPDVTLIEAVLLHPERLADVNAACARARAAGARTVLAAHLPA